jgi:hypothetical protein
MHAAVLRAGEAEDDRPLAFDALACCRQAVRIQPAPCQRLRRHGREGGDVGTPQVRRAVRHEALAHRQVFDAVADQARLRQAQQREDGAQDEGGDSWHERRLDGNA